MTAAYVYLGHLDSDANFRFADPWMFGNLAVVISQAVLEKIFE